MKDRSGSHLKAGAGGCDMRHVEVPQGVSVTFYGRVSGVVIQTRSNSDQYVTEVEVHLSINVETNNTSLGRFPHISATTFLFCGMCMGVLTTGADLMGVIIFGTGITLSVTVIYYIHKLERNSWTVMQALPNNRY